MVDIAAAVHEADGILSTASQTYPERKSQKVKSQHYQTHFDSSQPGLPRPVSRPQSAGLQLFLALALDSAVEAHELDEPLRALLPADVRRLGEGRAARGVLRADESGTGARRQFASGGELRVQRGLVQRR